MPQWKIASEAQTYQDKEKGFFFQYPKGWEMIPENDLTFRNEKFIAGVYIPDWPSTAVGVILEKIDASKQFDKKQFIEYLKKNFKEKLQDFHLISLKNRQRNQTYVHDISYTYKHLGKVYVRQRQKIIVTQKAIYYISGSSHLTRYSQYKNQLNFILDSFTLKSFE